MAAAVPRRLVQHFVSTRPCHLWGYLRRTSPLGGAAFSWRSNSVRKDTECRGAAAHRPVQPSLVHYSDLSLKSITVLSKKYWQNMLSEFREARLAEFGGVGHHAAVRPPAGSCVCLLRPSRSCVSCHGLLHSRTACGRPYGLFVMRSTGGVDRPEAWFSGSPSSNCPLSIDGAIQFFDSQFSHVRDAEI